uniref:Uncharacterized protein n=1 Tax=Timema genevievae TaxID=629358 RepID=A0A7R9JW53_TIMGE|nr:unnamed protein product [Timema genevievae]
MLALTRKNRIRNEVVWTKAGEQGVDDKVEKAKSEMLTGVRDRCLDRDLERVLDRCIDRDLEGDLDRCLDCDLVGVLDRCLDRDLEGDLDRCLDRDLVGVLDRCLDLIKVWFLAPSPAIGLPEGMVESTASWVEASPSVVIAWIIVIEARMGVVALIVIGRVPLLVLILGTHVEVIVIKAFCAPVQLVSLLSLSSVDVTSLVSSLESSVSILVPLLRTTSLVVDVAASTLRNLVKRSFSRSSLLPCSQLELALSESRPFSQFLSALPPPEKHPSCYLILSVPGSCEDTPLAYTCGLTVERGGLARTASQSAHPIKRLCLTLCGREASDSRHLSSAGRISLPSFPPSPLKSGKGLRPLEGSAFLPPAPNPMPTALHSGLALSLLAAHPYSRKLIETPNEVPCTSSDTDWTNNTTLQQKQEPVPDQARKQTAVSSSSEGLINKKRRQYYKLRSSLIDPNSGQLILSEICYLIWILMAKSIVIDLYNITGWTSVAEIFELSSAYNCKLETSAYFSKTRSLNWVADYRRTFFLASPAHLNLFFTRSVNYHKINPRLDNGCP